ncbi:hypothetical protein BJX68DRAFT_219627 [Aspergillus pseudodeflectus]|uniref:Uncharacterized protein n=2 Tax=Aspergillus subgen. Nidulantes TaxID=2720870 RepID=A0A0U5GNQ6_ASPCI|nr:hypothetical protein ASPCAL03559 [Aspergillus calidoustus]
MSDPSLGIKKVWRMKLQFYCDKTSVAPPIYNTFSDRRGGRTAWSCSVVVHGTTFHSRYWFDGEYVENAMEDAAEVAIKVLDPGACQPSSGGNFPGTID